MPYELPMIDNKTIVTETGGFLGSGFTHTVSLSLGCSFANSLCGLYCYVQTNFHVTKGRPWGLYGYKKNIRDAYRQQYDQIKRPRRSEPKPLRIFMSSSMDPYAPQEITLCSTRALLEEMNERPPDVLVIQTRSPLIGRDRDLIVALAKRFELWVSVTVETDMERVPGLPNHATPPRKRIATLKTFHEAGVLTQAAVSPLLPLADPERFACHLDQACGRVILDHFMIGDGSKDGLRTKRTGFPQLLEHAGFGEWNCLEKLYEVKAVFDRVLGPARVLVSADGFNAVGPNRK